ncbi:MAG: hypothetical protein MUC67_02325 [Acidobacteria bacterium]|jgi:hypothetical protein|nr:hypothetical protein [Acidobacteriota bacterium]MCU0253730.1 hypothetical protein [Acidobacteriota bacterium]
MKKGGGFGLLMLVVVMAIVLLLVAQNWKAAAPRLTEAMQTRPQAAASDGASGSSRTLPGVGEMKKATDRHAGAVQEALAESP